MADVVVPADVETTTTGPDVADVVVPVVTTTSVAVCDTNVAETPATVTLVTSEPSLNDVPVIVTWVPPLIKPV